MMPKFFCPVRLCSKSLTKKGQLQSKFVSDEAVFWCSFLSGCAAGSFAALTVNPFDVVKTRLQAITKAEGEVVYNGVGDAIV